MVHNSIHRYSEHAQHSIMIYWGYWFIHAWIWALFAHDHCRTESIVPIRKGTQQHHSLDLALLQINEHLRRSLVYSRALLRTLRWWSSSQVCQAQRTITIAMEGMIRKQRTMRHVVHQIYFGRFSDWYLRAFMELNSKLVRASVAQPKCTVTDMSITNACQRSLSRHTYRYT